MKYEFPHISHLDDVRQAIDGRPEFKIMEKDGYTVVNYMLADENTFFDADEKTQAILRECRGIIFDADGMIMSRPFHKFFNLGEKTETLADNIDFTHEYVVLEKLDGSMIRPLFVGGGWRLGTKAGITDVSMQAEVFILDKPEYTKLFDECGAFTPIFEWCSNKQRIVVDHPVDRLVLTALRHNVTGYYMSHESLVAMGRQYGVPVVKAYHSFDLASCLEFCKANEGSEGFVLRFIGGHMIKIKADWYVKLHRVKDMVSREKDVIRLIIDEQLDDLFPTLLQVDRDRIQKFQHEFLEGARSTAEILKLCVEYARVDGLTKKAFALEILGSKMKRYSNLLFSIWDGKDPMATVIGKIDKSLSSSTKVEEVRFLFNARFNEVIE